MGPPPLFNPQDQVTGRPVEVTLSPVDGCVLLGKDEGSAMCDYATRYHVDDREAQRQQVSDHVIMDEVVPCCLPQGCALKERLWGVLRSELVLVSLHLIVLSIGYIKAFVHTMEDAEDLHLMHAVLETVLTCKILIIRAFVAKEKFHEIKERRLKLEYVMVAGASRARSVKIWTFVYFGCSLIMCAIIIGFFVVCFQYAHLGWIALPNNGMIIIAVFAARVTMMRYELMIAKIQQDHMLIVLFEAKTLLSEQLCAIATSRTKEVNVRVEHFLRGLNRTPDFNLPFYVVSLDEHIPQFPNVTMETGL